MHTAVVILNWNGREMLRRFLPGVVSSIAGYNAENRESGASASLVMADNGSTDGSTEWVRATFPGVTVLSLEKNHGFSGGYNRALRQLEADYFVLLNSDVHTPPGWLDPLVSFMEEHPRAGICQPRLRSESDPSCFEYAGAAGGYIDALEYPFCRGRILSHTEADTGQYDDAAEVFWASGACLVIRSALYRRLGGLDEAFFAHMEEIDLCWRARRLGYEVWCIPLSTVFHLGGGTLPAGSPRKLYLNFRNNLLMLHKNLPPSAFRKVLRRRMWLDRAAALAYLAGGKPANMKAVLQAHRDFRKMRRHMETNPSEEGNPTGIYRGSLFCAWVRQLGKPTFSRLRF